MMKQAIVCEFTEIRRCFDRANIYREYYVSTLIRLFAEHSECTQEKLSF